MKQRVGVIRTTLRRLVRAVIAAVLLLVVAVAVFAFKAASEGYPNDRRAVVQSEGFVAGAYHVHSSRSDGSGTLEEIAGDARAAGLRFVILTDHNVEPAPPEVVDGVLLVHGVELSTPNGHLVALGLPRALTQAERDGDAVATVAELGGVAFLSHPVQERNPWRSWEPLPKVAGLELYSGDTMLREALAAPVSRLLPAAGAYLTSTTHAIYTLVQEQPEATAKLLQLSAARPKVALCAHDAHGWPDYEDEFRALALYLPGQDGAKLPEEPRAAAGWLIEALAAGKGHCAFRALGDPEGFGITGLEPGTRSLKVGEKLRVIPPRNTPDAVRVQVSGNGVLEDRWTVRATGPGPIHVELWRRAPGRFLGSEWKPWIVPSPVHAHD